VGARLFAPTISTSIDLIIGFGITVDVESLRGLIDRLFLVSANDLEVQQISIFPSGPVDLDEEDDPVELDMPKRRY
jgi:hypothetical protein